jgi:SAM-dependent MidA family methyltransferase
VANEFFDALPIRQFVSTGDNLAERCVRLNEAGELCFGLDERHQLPGQVPAGGIVETCPAAIAIMGEIGHRIATQGGAALAIDYGYAGPAVGDTLQALAKHAFVDPLHDPGAADLTAHLDFSALAVAAERAGAAALPLMEQGAFLKALGIEQRAAQLALKGGDSIMAALERLVAPEQMGSLFKVLGIAPKGMVLPGFGNHVDL